MGLTIRLLMMRAAKAKRNFHKIDRAPLSTSRIRDESRRLLLNDGWNIK